MLVRAEVKPWQKMFIKNIPEELPNDLLQRLLKVIGNLKNFKRSQKEKGRLLPFCHFQYETGEEVLRATKFLNNIKILDKTMQLKTSEQTQSFIKQWMTMQKEEWKKKLMATGMNEAKEYQSLEKYLDRDDKTYADKMENALVQLNIDLKKLIQSKMKQDQRKQHPREKERDKRKKQFKEDMERKYNQKLEFWLKRERERQKDYRKQKEKEKQREKTKFRKLQRQMDLESDQESRRITKFLAIDRKKFRQKELIADQKVQIQWIPPEPAILIEPNAPEQPAPEDVEIEQAPKRVFTIMQEELDINHVPYQTEEQVIKEVLVIEPLKTVKNSSSEQSKTKPEFIVEQQIAEPLKKSYTLHLPHVDYDQMKKQQEEQRKKQEEMKVKLAELFKQVPQNKEGLWNYQIDWELLSKSVILEKKIRPWLASKSIEYMTQVEDKFITLIQKKLLSKSSPDKIVKVLRQLLEEDAEEFVIKLWKQLIFQILKMKNGLA